MYQKMRVDEHVPTNFKKSNFDMFMYICHPQKTARLYWVVGQHVGRSLVSIRKPLLTHKLRFYHFCIIVEGVSRSDRATLATLSCHVIYCYCLLGNPGFSLFLTSSQYLLLNRPIETYWIPTLVYYTEEVTHLPVSNLG